MNPSTRGDSRRGSARWRWVAAVIVVAVGVLVWRLAVHGSHLQPAIVTPSMDAQQAISPSLTGKIKRALNERVTYNDRADRPKLIALTFDDGPFPRTTPLLLDALHELDVPATFFLIGHDAEQWPELTERIRAQGNEIADHTYTHPNLDEENAATVREEILRGRDALFALTGDPAVRTLFRPPHGRYTLDTIHIAQSLGYHVVLWNDDAGDWRTVTPQELASHLTEHATAPDIVLLHSGKVATIDMLPEVVRKFRAAGYRFVTVSQMLAQVSVPDLNHPAKHPL
ncbi:MAG: polysaccharide deacetylase family protein [Candidatus Eremiobacteraeota bacterium]|nr:polysaccharide deacetylase family protein [Candidatus Eremiobacteraeota bacterium]